MKIADLFFQATLDDSRLAIDAKRSGEKAGATMGKASSTSYSKAFKDGIKIGAGVVAITALGSAISGVTDFMGESIEAASDLAESTSKVSVVFGDQADEIESWADRSAQAMGQSKRAAMEAAGTYGNLIKAFGGTDEQASQMSMSLVELASDLASFNNTSVDDALEALRSGLSGETEPLKRYGIALSDARMRTVLMEQGVRDLGSTLTPLQKTMAAYTLIMQDSALAQGDFARTSDQLANTIRIQQAELEDLKAEVGEGLIPVQLQWERGNLDLIRSLNTITNITSAGEKPRADLIDDMESLIRVVPGVGGVFGELTEGLFDDARASEAATEAARTNRRGLELWGDKAAQASEEGGHLADSFRRAVRPGGTLKDVLRDLGYAADETEEAIDDLATTITDELYGDAINAGNEARLKENIKDLREQRSEAKKGSPEWRELSGEIAENEKALFELHLEMAEREGPQAVIRFLDRQIAKLDKSETEAYQYLSALRKIYAMQVRFNDLGTITFGRYTGKTIPLYAEGGHYEAGVPRIVGENGPELDVPDHSGTIYPDLSPSSMTWAGTPSSSTTIAAGFGDVTVNVDARGLPNPGAVGSAVRQGVHDAMADVLRQQEARLPAGTRS